MATAALQSGSFNWCEKRRLILEARDSGLSHCGSLKQDCCTLGPTSPSSSFWSASFSNILHPRSFTLGDWWDLNSSVSRGLEMPVVQRKHGVFVSRVKDAGCRQHRAPEGHTTVSHSTLSAGLVAPCCRDCSHICCLSEQWRQCGNTPPHGTRECSPLVAFLEVPCNTASDHAWVRTEPHLVSAGKECDVFIERIVTSNDLRVLLLRRTGRWGMGVGF